jgi:TetR/AcrR family tetracycline transcriptional repressor
LPRLWRDSRIRCACAAAASARIFSGLFFPLPNALAYGDAMIAALREAGLSHRDAAWTADTYHVVAHTLEEQLADNATDRFTAAVDPDRHPHPRAHFEYGLRLILTGIRAGVTTDHRPVSSCQEKEGT